ncbi:MAG: ubiquitin-like small modifier protein 1 [Candidatus Bathyarchaeia archaeon]
MKVKVRYFTTLRELARTIEEEIEMENGATLSDLLEKIVLKYGETAHNYLYDKESGAVDPSIQFLINGVSMRNLQGVRTELKDGNVVAIVPPIGGG